MSICMQFTTSNYGCQGLTFFFLLFSCMRVMIIVVMNMIIHKSAEDYLEAMLMLKEERGYVRSVDVAEKLDVTKPSVSYATKRLRESGYITLDPAGMIILLEPGLEIAERMYERHKLLTELLINLGVSPETAREDACKIEHDLSIESFDAIRNRVRKCC